MKKILVTLLILGLIGVLSYLIWNQNINKREGQNNIGDKEEDLEKENIETKTIFPIAVGYEAKLLDLKSSSLSSIHGNPEAEVIFGESVDGKWIIVSEGKREVAPGPSPDFFLSGWNLYRVNKETGEKLPIVTDKNVIVAVRSPKEDLIAYVTYTHGLWLVNLDGTNKRQVIQDNIVIAGNILWGKRTGEPFIFWSFDGKKIAFSTFPKDYKGGDLWETQGVELYLLKQNEFKILGEDIYNVFNVWGWYDDDNILVNIAQPFIYDPKKGEVLRSESTGFHILNLEGKCEFFGPGYSGSTDDALIKNNKVYVLIPEQKRKSNDPFNPDFNVSWQNLQIVIYNNIKEWDEPKTLVENLLDGYYTRFTPDGRIIYENREGRLVIINLDGSNPIVLPEDIKLPIYFAV
ncbi:hypothetical protein KBH77_02430 [Patescibacteria group bacterium]|nr:hypothetical protein [Patescibacteria group bacterium]